MAQSKFTLYKYIKLAAQRQRTISYCLKDGSGTIHAEGMIPATRFDLDPHRCSARREVCTARLPNAGK